MSQIININEKNIIHNILEGASLGSFTFHTHFVLELYTSDRFYNNPNIPKSIILVIESEWWFGERDAWWKTVEKLTNGYTFIEPEEPVLAFKLAALRWSDGNVVESVELSTDELKLYFANGESITISNHLEDEAAWKIIMDYSKIDESYSIVCEDNIIYCCEKKNNSEGENK